MSGLLPVLQNHVAYNAWATRRILTAAASLNEEERTRNFGTADKSILGTFVHLFRSERIWFQRLQFGTPKIPWGLPTDESWDSLEDQWPKLHSDWQAWAQSLDESAPHRVIQYSDLKGNPWSHPIWPLLLHVVNHSTHHRGQVSGFMRALGRTPPSLDFITYVREKGV